VLLWYEEDLPFPTRRFCLREGGADLVEGEWKRSRGHENTFVDQVDNFLDLIKYTTLFKDLDIYECLSPCNECTGSYSGLGMKVRCLCNCHSKQSERSA
jgi:hypothetical protein